MEGSDWLGSRPTSFMPNPVHFMDWRTSWPPAADLHPIFNHCRQRSWNQLPFRCCCDGYTCMSSSFPFYGSEETRNLMSNYGTYPGGYPPNPYDSQEPSLKSPAHRYHPAHNWHGDRLNPYTSRHVTQTSTHRNEDVMFKGNKPPDHSSPRSRDSNEHPLSIKRKPKRNGHSNCVGSKNDIQMIKRCCNDQQQHSLDTFQANQLQAEIPKPPIEAYENTITGYTNDVDMSLQNLNEGKNMQITLYYEVNENLMETPDALSEKQLQNQKTNENCQKSEQSAKDNEVSDVINEILLSSNTSQLIENKDNDIETKEDKRAFIGDSNEEGNIIFLDEDGVLSFANAEIISYNALDTDKVGTFPEFNENTILITKDAEDNLADNKNNDAFPGEGLKQDKLAGPSVDVSFLEKTAEGNFILDENWDGDLFFVPSAYEEVISQEIQAVTEEIVEETNN